MPTIELVQKLQENSDNLEQLAKQPLAKWEESEGPANAERFVALKGRASGSQGKQFSLDKAF